MKFSLTVTCDMEEPPEFRVQQKNFQKLLQTEVLDQNQRPRRISCLT